MNRQLRIGQRHVADLGTDERLHEERIGLSIYDAMFKLKCLETEADRPSSICSM